MYITQRHISRRTVLRGMGVTMALPFLEAMVPARSVFAKAAPGKVRLACIEMVEQAGGCSYGYSCVYTDSISWASPKQPLPMIRDPRVVFDQLFGAGATPEERAERRMEDRSILDWIGNSVARLKKELGAA